MNRLIRKISFVHEGKEAYPEVAAYRAFFGSILETEEISPSVLAAKDDLSDTICWHIMGHYPQRPEAALVVHDYRSLSLRPFAAIKDLIKKFSNARPDIRIFQNEAIQRALGFKDSVPFALLPMGVPPEILLFRQEKPEPSHDFCYIGVISAERKTDRLLDSFLRRYGEGKSFVLYGNPEPAIAARYKNRPNIVFAGRKPQKELFPALLRARAAVNYFPLHRPHCFQTPTKLLEYAALGLRILSNEHPQSRRAADTYNIKSLWGPAQDLFRDAPDRLDWATNEGLDPAPFLWPDVIAHSGLPALIDKVLQK